MPALQRAAGRGEKKKAKTLAASALVNGGAHERGHEAHDFPLDSYRLRLADDRLHLRFSEGYSVLRLVYSRSLSPRVADFRPVDVEGPRHPSPLFERLDYR